MRVKPGVDPISISDGMLDQLGLGANVNFVFASNMMSDTSAKLQRITGGLYGAAAGVCTSVPKSNSEVCPSTFFRRASVAVSSTSS